LATEHRSSQASESSALTTPSAFDYLKQVDDITRMSTPALWWSLSAVLVLMELLTGTVYLLMVSIGFVAGGVAAYIEWNSSAQLLVAGLVSSAATLAWHARRAKGEHTAPSADKNMQMDIGGVLEVRTWDENGRARVMYRGAEWSVKSSATAPNPLPTGTHRIVEVRGNTLIVSPADDAHTAASGASPRITN
jgi:membrane protein implicated in regulation of membrane protease activity